MEDSYFDFELTVSESSEHSDGNEEVKTPQETQPELNDSPNVEDKTSAEVKKTDNKPKEKPKKCSICLTEFRPNSKIYTCPECNCMLHESCLLDYLTNYEFNRCYCISCNRLFTNAEMKQHLKPMTYKQYIQKQVSTFNEQFMLQTMTRVNDILFYYGKLRDIANHLLDKSYHSADEFRRFLYFVHTYTYIDLYEFLKRRGIKPLVERKDEIVDTHEDSSSSEDYFIDEENNLVAYRRFHDENKEYERIWKWQEELVKQIHSWHGNPFIFRMDGLPRCYDFTKIWCSCIYKVLYIDIFDPEFKQFIDEFKDMPNDFLTYVLPGLDHELYPDIGHAIKLEKQQVEFKPVSFMMCSECKGLVVCLNKHVYCQECRQEYCYDCGEKKELKDGKSIHVCNEITRETFKTVRMNTHSCPKCGVRIQKSTGCDHMFCTACHTSFNWKTGKIITVNVHNPHRDEWLRSLGRSTEVTLFDVLHEMDDVQVPQNACGPIRMNTLMEMLLPSLICSFNSLINYFDEFLEEHTPEDQNRTFVDIYIAQRKDALHQPSERKDKNIKKMLNEHLNMLYGYDRLYDELREFIDVGRDLIRQCQRLCLPEVHIMNYGRDINGRVISRSETDRFIKEYKTYKETNRDQINNIKALAYQMTLSVFRTIECLCRDTLKTLVLQKLLNLSHFFPYLVDLLAAWAHDGNEIDDIFEFFVARGSAKRNAIKKMDDEFVM